MQRPTRIPVFGVLCLLVSAMSGLDNLNSLGVAVVGPGVFESSQAMPEGMPFAEMLDQTASAMVEALKQPTYRVALGSESAVGAAMAGMLLVAGIGLLRDQRWALRLARVWAYFALVSAVVTVVLQARFVMPHVSSGPPGSAVLGSVCMLPVFWLFPVLVLTVLGRPGVARYMQWKAKQSGASPFGPIQNPMSPPQSPQETTQQAPPSPAQRLQSDTPPADRTWRDDPWNDPSING